MRSFWKVPVAGLSLLVCLAAAPADVRAEPLTFHGTFFLIDPSPNRLDLFSNPGVLLEPSTYRGTIHPPVYLFGAFVTHTGGQSFTDTIRFTYQEEGAAPLIFAQTFTTGFDPVTLGFGASFEPIHRTGTAIPTTLTVELLSSSPDFVIPGGPDQGRLVDSYTYSFATVAPIPEPGTLLLVSGAGVAYATRRLRRRAQA